MISLFVPGIPAPQGSKRHLGNGIMVESSKRVKPWRTDIREAALEHFPDGPMTEPVGIDLVFGFDRPKGHYRTGRNAHLLRDAAPTHHIIRPDLDKLQRAVLDALTKVAWCDDSQVCRITATKGYFGDAGVLIQIKPEFILKPVTVPSAVG